MILLATTSGAESLSDANLATRAEAAFQQGRAARGTPSDPRPFFREAAEHYEALRRRGHDQAALHQAQGNAAFLAGDLPQAILAYRRGLLRTPGARDLRANLAHAREQVAYPTAGSFGRPPVSHWPPWLPRPTVGTVFAVAVVFYCLTWLALMRWRMTRRVRLVSIALSC